MKRLLLVLSLIVSSAAYATNSPPGFDSARWDKLVNHVVLAGKPMDIDEGRMFVLSHLVPAEPTAPHLADYLSTVGIDAPDGYLVRRLSAVSENWTKVVDGNWDIDQWIYDLQPNGELSRVTHVHLVETPAGQVVQDDSLPTGGASDPAVLQQWGEKLEAWYLLAGVPIGS